MVTSFLVATVLLVVVAASPLVEIPVPKSQQSGEISNIRLLVPLSVRDKPSRAWHPPRAPLSFDISWKPADYPDYSYEYGDRQAKGQNHVRDDPKLHRVKEPEKRGKMPGDKRLSDAGDRESVNEWLQSLDSNWIHDIDRHQLYDLNDRLHDASKPDAYEITNNHVSSSERFADKIAANYKENDRIADRETNNQNNENLERYGEDVNKWLHQFYASLMKQSREKRKPSIKIEDNNDGNGLDTFGGKIEDNDDIKAWLQKLDESLHFSENEDNLQYAFDGQNFPQVADKPDEESSKVVVIDRSQLTDGVLSNILSEALQADSEEYHPKTANIDLSAVPQMKALKDGVFSSIPAEAFQLDSVEYRPNTVKKDLSATPELKILSVQTLCGDEPGEVGGTCGLCCAIRQLVEELNFQDQKDHVDSGRAKHTESGKSTSWFNPSEKVAREPILTDEESVNIFEPTEKLLKIFKPGEVEESKPGKKPLDFGAMFSGLGSDKLHINTFRVPGSSPVAKLLHSYEDSFSPEHMKPVDSAREDPTDPVVVPEGSGSIPDGAIPVILAVVPSRRDWHVLVPPEGTPDAERLKLYFLDHK